MSTSAVPEQSTALPVIFELAPAGTFLPAKVRCTALDRRARQLPTALLALYERLGVSRARYVRGDGTESIIVFDGDGHRRFEDTRPVTLQSYTVSGVAQYLCPVCADKTPNKAKWSGELINGYCDGCGAGPSVPHFPIAPAPEQPPLCPTCGTDGGPCVDCNPAEIRAALAPRLVEDARALAELADARAAGEGYCVRGGCGQLATAIIARGADQAAYCADHADDVLNPPPPELLPILDAFAAAWDERALSLARVARALAPEPLVEQRPAGCRVRVTFGPDAGCVGTVVSGPSGDGYYSVKIDGREPDAWGSLWFFLPHEIALTTTPPAEDRPWANDAAYAAEGQCIS